MAKKKQLPIDDEHLLERVSEDFKYADIVKNQTTISLDATGTITRINLSSKQMMRIMELFYNGDQWEVDKDGTPIDKSKHIALPVVNYVKTIINQRVDLFKRRKITIDVKPVGEDDLNLALAVEFLLKYFWKKQNVSLKLAQAYQDALIYMAGFLKIVWNDITDDLDIIPISPFDVYPDPYATELNNARYIHIVYKKPAEYVYNKYGVKIMQKNKNDEEYFDPNKDVIIYESWYSAGIFGDNAMCIIWTNNQILDIKKVSDITGSDTFPIFCFKTKRKSNSFWGSSLVYDLIDIQQLHNKTLGFVLDSMVLANNGRIVTSDPNIKISNDPREIITISSKDEMISTLNLATVDPRWFSLIQYSGYNLGQSLSGTYAINMGGNPPTQTATGIVALQNAGLSGVEADIFELTFEINRLGTVMIQMIQQLYGTDRITNILRKSKYRDTAEELAQKIATIPFEIYFDLSDPLPDDKLSRNNFLAGLLMQKAIDLTTYARLTGNMELLNILKEQEAQQANQPNPLTALLQGMSGQQPQQPAGQQPQQPVEQQQRKEEQLVENAKKRAGLGEGI